MHKPADDPPHTTTTTTRIISFDDAPLGAGCTTAVGGDASADAGGGDAASMGAGGGNIGVDPPAVVVGGVVANEDTRGGGGLAINLVGTGVRGGAGGLLWTDWMTMVCAGGGGSLGEVGEGVGGGGEGLGKVIAGAGAKVSGVGAELVGDCTGGFGDAGALMPLREPKALATSVLRAVMFFNTCGLPAGVGPDIAVTASGGGLIVLGAACVFM